MIDLVIIACLVASPAECRPHVFQTAGSISACTRSALPRIVDWAEAHREWKIMRFECRQGGKRA